jgi:hypothetical protein
MEVHEQVRCPYCGQMFYLAVDTTIEVQSFTTDCEICCRPIEVFVESEPGEVLRLETGG